MKEIICNTSSIKLSIPKKKLVNLFYDNKNINKNQADCLIKLNDKLEKNMNILLHTKSVVDKILLRKI